MFFPVAGTPCSSSAWWVVLCGAVKAMVMVCFVFYCGWYSVFKVCVVVGAVMAMVVLCFVFYCGWFSVFKVCVVCVVL